MERINLKQKLALLWQKRILVLIITIVFALFGILFFYKFDMTKNKASTTLILGKTSFSVNNIENVETIVSKNIEINESLISTYLELIRSNNLLQQVKNNLKLEMSIGDLNKNISAKRISKTDLIQITAKHADSKIATDIVNELTELFSKKVEEIYHVNHIYTIDTAISSERSNTIRVVKNIILFTIVGFVISSLSILVKNIFDTTIKTEKDIEEETGLKTLISIQNEKKNKKQLVNLLNTQSKSFKVFQDLKTNIQFINVNHKENKVILITSCFSSEGKSYVSSNLAVAFAKAGKKVILIDADLRRGKIARIFNTPNNLGFSNYLSGLDSNGIEINERINQFINETEIKNLNVITSGTIPPNPSEILTSEKLPELIKDLSVFYDFIILDAPAVLPTSDSLILTKMADSTILVSLCNKTKKEEINKATRVLQNVGGRVIGVVLNKVNRGQKGSKKEVSNTCFKNKNLTKLITTIKYKINSKIQEYKKRNNQLLLDTKISELENLESKNIEKEQSECNEQQLTLENILEEKKEEKVEIKKETEDKSKKENNKIENNQTEKEENIKEEKIEENNEKEENESLNESKFEKFSKVFKNNLEKAKSATKKLIEKAKNNFKSQKEKIADIRKEKTEKQVIEKQRKQEELQIKAEIKKQENEEKEKLQLEEKLKKEALKSEIKNKKIIEKEEKKKFKEQEKLKQKEEARIQEELLEDNLYPKTKHNKNL